MMLTLCSAVSMFVLGGGEPFPLVRAVPLPGQQIAFEIAGTEAARYRYSEARPYVFPFMGPAGQRLTRMGHPHDPDGHGHHRSIWVGHRDVNGANFWEASEAGIKHEGIEALTDGARAASVAVRLTWHDTGGEALLDERRAMTVRALPDNERYLDIVLTFAPAVGSVRFGETPFGFLGVRVAKTMGVKDGGGTILNSEGGVDEAGVFWKPARWVDYSGPVTPAERNGIALFDHPSNPRFPTRFHVRDDGWMGAAFTQSESFTLAKGETLTLRYRLYAHGGDATAETIGKHWQRFAEDVE